MQAKGFICVVVPVHNRISLARPVFEALLRESAVDGFVRVVVVDQQSTDGVGDLARELGFDVIASRAATAGGLRNAGTQATESDWLCFIDSDVLIPSGYFQRLRHVLADQADAIVGCNYALPERTTWSERTWHALTYERGDGEREWLNAGNLAIARELFVSAGGFDEHMASGEDTELCERFRKRGIRVYQSEMLAAAHLGNPKSLRAFFAKQIWHGQGASLGNRNSLAAIAYALILVLAVAILAWHSPISPAMLTVGFAASNLVPVLAFMAVGSTRRNSTSLGQSLVLLHVYCLARFVALCYRSTKQR